MNTPSDPVRQHTDDEVLQRIDDATYNDLLDMADAPATAVHHRLDQLDREWDVDRVVETKAALSGLAGLAFAALGKRSSLRMPLLAASGLLMYASRGRNLFQPLYRRAGIRTSQEIENERHALCALTGRQARELADLRSARARAPASSPEPVAAVIGKPTPTS